MNWEMVGAVAGIIALLFTVFLEWPRFKLRLSELKLSERKLPELRWPGPNFSQARLIAPTAPVKPRKLGISPLYGSALGDKVELWALILAGLGGLFFLLSLFIQPLSDLGWAGIWAFSIGGGVLCLKTGFEQDDIFEKGLYGGIGVIWLVVAVLILLLFIISLIR